MRLIQHVKRWLSKLSPSASTQFMNADLPSNTANDIWRVHSAIDTVYGTGFAKDNPTIVAQFMMALSTQTIATELAALREIIGSGSGGITVGLEK